MIDKYNKLNDFGKNLLAKESLIDGLLYISKSAKDIMGSDRCSLFIYEKDKSELWTTLADESQKITIPFDMGIVGKTLRVQKPIVENDAYDNPNFMSDVDIRTGYYTQNILTSPIFDSKREVIAVLQLLNKEGGFHKKDLEFISFFSHFISGFIESKNLEQLLNSDES
jgi:signal transduction protein with GAF and PtsI domain